MRRTNENNTTTTVATKFVSKVLTSELIKELKAQGLKFPRGLAAWKELDGTFNCNAFDILIKMSKESKMIEVNGVMQHSLPESVAYESAARILAVLRGEEVKDRLLQIEEEGCSIHGKRYVKAARKLLLNKTDNLDVVGLKFIKTQVGVKVVPQMTTMAENEAIRLQLFKKEKQNYKLSFGKGHYNNLTKDILVLDFQKCQDAVLNTSMIYVFWHGLNTRFLRQSVVSDTLIDLLTDEPTKFKVDNPLLKKYEIVGGSPSSLRKIQVLAFDVTKDYEKTENIINALTEGVYNIEKGRQITLKELAKYVTRFFAWTAPNKNLGTISHYAISFFKWTNGSQDGAAYISSVFDSKCLSNALNIKISPKDVQGEDRQCRPWSAKVNGQVVRPSFIKRFINKIGKVIYLPEVTEEDKKELDKAFAKNKLSKYYNKTVVFGTEDDDIEFISDLNGYKTIIDWGKPSNYRVLDIGKPGIAHTSIQMLEVILNNPNVSFKQVLKLIKTLRQEMFEKEYEALKEKKIEVPSFEQIQKNYYPQMVIDAIAPEYVREKDFNLFKKLVENLLEREVKASNRFAWKIDGTFARMASDPSVFFDPYGILAYGEIWSPDATAYFDDNNNSTKYFGEDEDVVLCWVNRIITCFKYPKMGMHEFYKAHALTPEELISRVKDRENLSKAEKEEIITYFLSTKPGNVVVPGLDLLMNLLAGSDFDFDGMSLVFDARFNALTPNDTFIVKITGDNDPGEKDLCLKAKSMKQCFIKYATASKDGWGVGPVTNCNSIQLAVLTLLKMAKEEKKANYEKLMRNMLISWFGNTNGTGNYVPLERKDILIDNTKIVNRKFDDELDVKHISAVIVEISKEKISAMVEIIKNSDWNDRNNLIAIFEDLNIVFRYYQEGVIDSAKTGNMIDIEVAPGRKYHAYMLNNNGFACSWDIEKGLCRSEVVFNYEHSTSKTPFMDTLAIIRNNFISKDIIKDIDACVENMQKEGKFKTNMDDLRKLAYFTANEFLDLNKAMFLLKKVYGDITNKWLQDKAAATDADVLAGINEWYKNQIDAVASYGRHLMNAFEYADIIGLPERLRGSYLKFVSSYSMSYNKDTKMFTYSILDNGGSGFSSKCFQRETLEYVIKRYAKINFCGEQLVYNDGYVDGETVVFCKGIAEFAAVAKDINGEFVIKEFDGRFYASRSILDVVEKEELKENRFIFRINYFEDSMINKIDTNKPIELHARMFYDEYSKKQFDYAAYQNGKKLFGIETQSKLQNKVLDGKTVMIDQIITGVNDKASYGILVTK